ncbi:DUF3995 domain-containing protein [Nakamurella sp.]|uniref:DUF3995 domain-containing protein n=1 Tax=Nakamurella sp. TaxID=1869182 RepID=UPI003B3A1ECC
MRRARWGTIALWGAAVAGGIHGLFSLYWAVGGRWLLDTVGAWAVDLTERAQVLVVLLLLLVAAVKAAAAVIPLAVEAGRMPGRRRWRAVEWAGVALLVGYGGLTTIVAALVLLGAIEPDGGYDRASMIGHALLWDPLFLVWGVLLGIGLALTRDRAIPAGDGRDGDRPAGRAAGIQLRSD